MLKKFNEFDSKYSTLFFFFSLFFILLCLVFLNIANRSNSKECSVPSDLVDDSKRYIYNITIDNNGKNTKLYIKRYGFKYLIEKEENEVKSTYYIYYTDIYEKASTGEYIKFRSDNIVDEIDNKLLFIDYINEISLESKVSQEDGITCYNNRAMGISMCVNLDDSITLKEDDLTITYEIKKIGMVDDFDIEIDSDEDIDSTIDTEDTTDISEY